MRLGGNLAMFVLLAWLAPRDSAAPSHHTFRGKFTGRRGACCTWELNGYMPLTLNVTCPVVITTGKPVRDYTCEYSAELPFCRREHMHPVPVRSPFWKRVSRDLKRYRRHLCSEPHETMQMRMCKSVPADAPFRLVSPLREITMTTTAGLREDTPTTECAQRADHPKLRRCGAAWARNCERLIQSSPAYRGGYVPPTPRRR